MKKERLTPSNGPTLKFVGQQIASVEFETTAHDPMQVGFEIWETQGGALIAYSSSFPLDRDGVEASRATVVEPIKVDPANIGEELGSLLSGEGQPVDEQAMRFAVMDHFGWHDRARNMVRKQLGWSLNREVD